MWKLPSGVLLVAPVETQMMPIGLPPLTTMRICRDLSTSRCVEGLEYLGLMSLAPSSLRQHAVLNT